MLLHELLPHCLSCMRFHLSLEKHFQQFYLSITYSLLLVQVTSSMESESCAFSCLPQDLCHSFLQQAFKQLDQRHLCGIAPLVCHPWHTLAVSCSSSLDVKVHTAAAEKSLTSWVQRNGSVLEQLSLSLDGRRDNICTVASTTEQLLQSVATNAANLQSLSLEGDVRGGTYSDASLSSLSQLTSLKLSSFTLVPGMVSSLSALTQLKSLDLSRTAVAGLDSSDMIIGPSSQWTQLTSLDLSQTHHSFFRPQSLGRLVSSVPQLKRLRLKHVGICASMLSQLPARIEVPAIDLVVTQQSHRQAEGWLQCSGKAVEELKVQFLGPLGGAVFQRLFALLKPELAPRLQSFSLWDGDLRGHCSGLGELTQISTLSFNSCSMQSADVISLSGLRGLRALLFFSGGLEGVDCSQESMDCLANGLRHLTMLAVDAVRGSTHSLVAAQQAFKKRIISSDRNFLTLKPSA